MATIQDKIRLAREFGTMIQEAFTRQQFNIMLDRNKAEPAESGVCHTHDFCDANMYMHEAFEKTFGREPDTNDDSDLESWNDAWAIAKAADFFA
jgi:hypothetical protein